MNTPTTPSGPAELRITAQVSQSRKYATPAGSAVHELLLSQGPNTLPLLARREFDASPASHIVAQRLANQFRPGTRATVTARGWRFNPQRQLLELLATDHCEQAPALTLTEATSP